MDLVDQAIDTAKSVFGHFLHDFLNTADKEDAIRRWNLSMKAAVPTQAAPSATTKEKEQAKEQEKVALAAQEKKIARQVQADGALATLLLMASGFDPQDKRNSTNTAMEVLSRFPVLNEVNLYVLALQLVETEKADKQNKVSAAAETERLKEATEALKGLEAKDAKNQGVLGSFFNVFTTSDAEVDTKKKLDALKETMERFNLSGGNTIAGDGDETALTGIGALAVRNGLSMERSTLPPNLEDIKKRTRRRSIPDYTDQVQTKYYTQGPNGSITRNTPKALPTLTPKTTMEKA